MTDLIGYAHPRTPVATILARFKRLVGKRYSADSAMHIRGAHFGHVLPAIHRCERATHCEIQPQSSLETSSPGKWSRRDRFSSRRTLLS